MFDVITCGSSTIDVFGDTDYEVIKIKTRKYEEDHIAYPSGVKLLIKQLNFRIGGGGVNTAIALSKLGLRTAYLGNLGKDNNGDMIIKHLKKHNVEFIGTRDEHQTGYSIILDSIERDRTILKYSGANDYLYYSKLNTAKLKTKWFYFTSMMNTSFRTIVKLAELANKKRIKVMFNPSNYVVKKGYRHLARLMKLCDVFMVNHIEAYTLARTKGIKNQLKALRNRGPKIVIVTEGKEGAGLFDGKFFLYVKACELKPVEVTGAGDTFGASFLAGLIYKPRDFTFALKLAQVNAESVIMKTGAHAGLLSYKQALKALKKPIRVVKLK